MSMSVRSEKSRGVSPCCMSTRGILVLQLSRKKHGDSSHRSSQSSKFCEEHATHIMRVRRVQPIREAMPTIREQREGGGRRRRRMLMMRCQRPAGGDVHRASPLTPRPQMSADTSACPSGHGMYSPPPGSTSADTSACRQSRRREGGGGARAPQLLLRPLLRAT